MAHCVWHLLYHMQLAVLYSTTLYICDDGAQDEARLKTLLLRTDDLQNAHGRWSWTWNALRFNTRTFLDAIHPTKHHNVRTTTDTDRGEWNNKSDHGNGIRGGANPYLVGLRGTNNHQLRVSPQTSSMVGLVGRTNALRDRFHVSFLKIISIHSLLNCHSFASSMSPLLMDGAGWSDRSLASRLRRLLRRLFRWSLNCDMYSGFTFSWACRITPPW